MSGPAFQGTFDGQGHAVKNLKIVVPADAAAGSAWGLFGVLKGATVRNLAIGEGSSVVSDRGRDDGPWEPWPDMPMKPRSRIVRTVRRSTFRAAGTTYANRLAASSALICANEK